MFKHNDTNLKLNLVLSFKSFTIFQYCHNAGFIVVIFMGSKKLTVLVAVVSGIIVMVGISAVLSMFGFFGYGNAFKDVGSSVIGSANPFSSSLSVLLS